MLERLRIALRYWLGPIIICLVFSILIPSQANATVLFQENFDNYPDFNSVLQNWQIIRNSCNSDWILSSGRVGIKIVNSPVCETDLIPRSSVWNVGNDYIYELDATFVSGTDKNFAFRYNTSPIKFYDYHFQINCSSDGSDPACQPGQARIILERVNNSQIYPNKVKYLIANGHTYHIKIIANGNHLTLYIDNNLVLDYPDAGDRSNTGKIALRAGVGGDQSTEVYFDNIVVSSIDPVVEPVVFLPGMMGSWCAQALTLGGECPTTWKDLPEPLDPYDSLIASLQQAPDIGSGNVFAWYYDWRKPIATLANQLSDYIDNAVLSGRPVGTKVRLVGHSYGGLVASQYAQAHADRVSKIVTAGSPHQGALNSYGAWEGGEFWDFPIWQRVVVKLLLASQGNTFRTSKDALRSIIPSVRDVLPTFDYLVNSNNNPIAESSLIERNTQLPIQYTGLSSIASMLTTMTGAGQNTLETVKVKTPNWVQQSLGLWTDGAPDQLNDSSAGDNSVLVRSGKFTGALATPELATTHAGLISETAGINTILSAIGSTGTAAIVEGAMGDSQEYAALRVRSPATISAVVNGITYTDDDGDGILIVPVSADGIATATLAGTGTGAYHLDVLQFDSNGDSSVTYTGNISIGETQTLSLYLSPSSPKENPLVDMNGTIFLDFASGILQESSPTLTTISTARTKLLLQSSFTSLSALVLRAKQQINAPIACVKTIESAILSLHKLRESINTYESQGLSQSSATKLRNLLQETNEQLQSAYSAVAIRAGKTYTPKSFVSSESLVGRTKIQVDAKSARATKKLAQGASATLAAQSDWDTAKNEKSTTPSLSYINYLSAKLYLQEAMNVMK